MKSSMKTLSLVFTSLLVVSLIVVGANLPVRQSNAAEPVVEAVMTVDDVRFTVDRTDSRGLMVVVHGTVPSGGWFDAKLKPHSYQSAPEDNMLDVDFVATRPEIISTQVLSPVTAQLTIPVDSWVRGVRVHARTNTMEGRIGG